MSDSHAPAGVPARTADLQPIGDALRATFVARSDGLPDDFARLFIELAHLPHDRPAPRVSPPPADSRLRRFTRTALGMLRRPA